MSGLGNKRKETSLSTKEKGKRPVKKRNVEEDFQLPYTSDNLIGVDNSKLKPMDPVFMQEIVDTSDHLPLYVTASTSTNPYVSSPISESKENRLIIENCQASALALPEINTIGMLSFSQAKIAQESIRILLKTAMAHEQQPHS